MGQDRYVTDMNEKPDVYSLPELYDIAFGDRPIDAEADFVRRVAQQSLGRPARSFLELACGPAAHARSLARSGLIADGLDSSPDMIRYARACVSRELGTTRLIEADMTSFAADQPYDCCLLLLCGFSHLLTNERIIANLHAVADALADRGAYVINHPHPRDFFAPESSFPESERIWTAERDGLRVTTDWGGEHQSYDPISEIDNLTVSFTAANGETEKRHEFPLQLRRCSYQTFLALVELSGRFELAATFGDYSVDCPFDTSEESVRLVTVLRKKR